MVSNALKNYASIILSSLALLLGVFIVLGYKTSSLPYIVLAYGNGILTLAIPVLAKKLGQEHRGVIIE